MATANRVRPTSMAQSAPRRARAMEAPAGMVLRETAFAHRVCAGFTAQNALRACASTARALTTPSERDIAWACVTAVTLERLATRPAIASLSLACVTWRLMEMAHAHRALKDDLDPTARTTARVPRDSRAPKVQQAMDSVLARVVTGSSDPTQTVKTAFLRDMARRAIQSARVQWMGSASLAKPATEHARARAPTLLTVATATSPQTVSTESLTHAHALEPTLASAAIHENMAHTAITHASALVAPCNNGISGDGSCSGACYDGFAGVNCDTCVSGRYGPNCTECKCKTENGVCNETISGDGTCSSCSRAGFARPLCDDCEPGRYGPNCTECMCLASIGTCSEGVSGTGLCQSCIKNYFKPGNCTECEDGTYGSECTPCACFKGKCNDGQLGNGACTCYQFYSGSNCDVDARVSGASASSSSGVNIGMIAGLVAAVGAGCAVAAAFILYRRRKNKKGFGKRKGFDDDDDLGMVPLKRRSRRSTRNDNNNATSFLNPMHRNHSHLDRVTTEGDRGYGGSRRFSDPDIPTITLSGDGGRYESVERNGGAPRKGSKFMPDEEGIYDRPKGDDEEPMYSSIRTVASPAASASEVIYDNNNARLAATRQSAMARPQRGGEIMYSTLNFHEQDMSGKPDHRESVYEVPKHGSKYSDQEDAEGVYSVPRSNTITTGVKYADVAFSTPAGPVSDYATPRPSAQGGSGDVGETNYSVIRQPR
eukprot:Opistho-2@92465